MNHSVIVSAMLLFLAVGIAAAADKRPNIVYIMADDHGR